MGTCVNKNIFCEILNWKEGMGDTEIIWALSQSHGAVINDYQYNILILSDNFVFKQMFSIRVTFLLYLYFELILSL